MSRTTRRILLKPEFPLSVESYTKWIGFALRGGIGTAESLCDREAKSDYDLMFYKGEQLVVLCPWERGSFVAAFEDVIGIIYLSDVVLDRQLRDKLEKSRLKKLAEQSKQSLPGSISIERQTTEDVLIGESPLVEHVPVAPLLQHPSRPSDALPSDTFRPVDVSKTDKAFVAEQEPAAEHEMVAQRASVSHLDRRSSRKRQSAETQSARQAAEESIVGKPTTDTMTRSHTLPTLPSTPTSPTSSEVKARRRMGVTLMSSPVAENYTNIPRSDTLPLNLNSVMNFDQGTRALSFQHPTRKDSSGLTGTLGQTGAPSSAESSASRGMGSVSVPRKASLSRGPVSPPPRGASSPGALASPPPRGDSSPQHMASPDQPRSPLSTRLQSPLSERMRSPLRSPSERVAPVASALSVTTRASSDVELSGFSNTVPHSTLQTVSDLDARPHDGRHVRGEPRGDQIITGEQGANVNARDQGADVPILNKKDSDVSIANKQDTAILHGSIYSHSDQSGSGSQHSIGRSRDDPGPLDPYTLAFNQHMRTSSQPQDGDNSSRDSFGVIFDSYVDDPRRESVASQSMAGNTGYQTAENMEYLQDHYLNPNTETGSKAQRSATPSPSSASSSSPQTCASNLSADSWGTSKEIESQQTQPEGLGIVSLPTRTSSRINLKKRVPPQLKIDSNFNDDSLAYLTLEEPLDMTPSTAMHSASTNQFSDRGPLSSTSFSSATAEYHQPLSVYAQDYASSSIQSPRGVTEAPSPGNIQWQTGPTASTLTGSGVGAYRNGLPPTQPAAGGPPTIPNEAGTGSFSARPNENGTGSFSARSNQTGTGVSAGNRGDLGQPPTDNEAYRQIGRGPSGSYYASGSAAATAGELYANKGDGATGIDQYSPYESSPSTEAPPFHIDGGPNGHTRFDSPTRTGMSRLESPTKAGVSRFDSVRLNAHDAPQQRVASVASSFSGTSLRSPSRSASNLRRKPSVSEHQRLEIGNLEFEILDPAEIASQARYYAPPTLSPGNLSTSIPGNLTSPIPRSESASSPMPSSRTLSSSYTASPRVNYSKSTLSLAKASVLRTEVGNSDDVSQHRNREKTWVTLTAKGDLASVRKNKKIRALVQAGVPSSVRGRVWPFLCAAPDSPAFASIDYCALAPDVADYIDFDSDTLCDGGAAHASKEDIGQVLKALLVARPELSYPGAAAVLLVANMLEQVPVSDAFAVLIALIDRYGLDIFFDRSRTVAYEREMATFAALLAALDPELHAFFSERAITPSEYYGAWSLSLFAAVLPLTSASRAVDVVLFDVRNKYKVALSLLLILKNTLLEPSLFQNRAGIVDYLTHPLDFPFAPTAQIATGLFAPTHPKLKDESKYHKFLRQQEVQ